MHSAAVGSAPSRSRRTLQPSPFVRDLAFTTFTSVATVLALVLSTRAAAAGLGPESFGAYMLSRRILSAIDPVSTLMMGVAVTRFVASAAEHARADYLAAGAVLAVVPGAVVLIGSLAFAEPLATLLFRTPAYAGLIRATGFMIFGYSWFTLLYAWYRAVDRMSVANMWQLAAVAIAPLALTLIFNRPGGETAIVAWSGVVLSAAAIPQLVEITRARHRAVSQRADAIRALAAYAVPRVPGGLAFGGLLAVGPLLSPYYGTLADAGYVAVGQSVLRVVEAATEAFGRVALPKMARLMASHGVAGGLHQPVAAVVPVVFHVGLFATLHLWLWAGEITTLWLGPEYEAAVPVIRMFALALLPYLAFVTLRSILDAVEVKAVNTLNVLSALAVTVVVALVLARVRYSAVAVSAATAAGLTLLGALTVAAVWRRCPFALGPLLIRECLGLNAALLVAAAAGRSWLHARVSGSESFLAGAVVLEALVAAAYGFALWRLQAQWIGEIARRLFAQEGRPL